MIFQVERKDTDKNAKRVFFENVKNKCQTEPYFQQSDIILSIGANQTTTQWLILNKLFDTDVPCYVSDLASRLELLPMVGIAMPLERNTYIPKLNTVVGRVFCVLPLPSDEVGEGVTGLPLHIHAYFGLADNRRSLKWTEVDQKHDPMAEWNELIVARLLPQAYVLFILHAIAKVSPYSIYQAWPNTNSIKHHWNKFLDYFHKVVAHQSILFTKTKHGQWISPSKAIFSNSMVGIPNDVVQAVTSYIESCDEDVVVLPEHVWEHIPHCVNKYKTVNPQLLRNCVRTHFVTDLSYEEKILLLQFSLHDDNFDDLQNVPLLPISGKQFTTFQPRHMYGSKPVLFPKPNNLQILLPGKCKSFQFTETNLPNTIHYKLGRVADSEKTQVRYMGNAHVFEYLYEVLPAAWFKHDNDTFRWTPDKNNHPSVRWLAEVWLWISREYPTSLSKFSNIPLFPVDGSTNTQLVKLNSNTHVIFAGNSTATLQSDVCKCLQTMGVVILTNQPNFIRHNALHEFIAPPTPEGVISILGNLSNNTYSKLSKEEKQALRRTLANVSKDSIIKNRAMLCNLPIFDTVPGSGGQSRQQFCNINDAKVAPYNLAQRTGYNNFRIKQLLIKADDPCSSNLLSLIGIERLKLASLLSTYIFPEMHGNYYQQCEIDQIMVWVLRHLNDMIKEKTDFRLDIEVIPFVKIDNHYNRVKPNNVFDPQDQVLQKLFQGENVFPIGPYAEQDIVPILRRVGLKNLGDVTASDIANTASIISKSNDFEHTAYNKAMEVLSLLNKSPKLLISYYNRLPLGSYLRKIKWVPRKTTRPDNYPLQLQWCDTDQMIFKPTDIFAYNAAVLVGGNLPVVPFEVVPDLKKMLVSESHISVPDLSSQLEKVVIAWNKCANWGYSESSKYNLKEIVYRIYEEIANRDSLYMQQIDFPWLWHGDGFTYPHMMALNTNFPFPLKPYLYKIPEQLLSMKSFLMQSGVKEEFAESDMIQVLEVIQANHQTDDEKNRSRDLSLSVSILNWITRDKEYISDDFKDRLLVPIDTCDGSLEFTLGQNCTYCDNDSLVNTYDSAIDDNITMIHHNISTETAQYLRIPSLSQRFIEPEELGFEVAGQHEPITTRLKNILKGYGEGMSIFKELIQNADDAGATEVKFLIDWRSNSSAMKSLFSKEMKECQGPALWSYNDAIFTDDDLKNINKLAGATKAQNRNKIGNFGLGFNAVYHLTDIPSFVSRNIFVMFDPNTSHISNLLKNNVRSGIKLNLENASTLRIYADQFKPYCGLFGCDLVRQKQYKGTLFRFPLHTPTTAVKSEISHVVYDAARMKNLIDGLYENAETLLLFTQHVSKVQVFEIVDDKTDITDPTVLFSIGVRDVMPLMKGMSVSREILAESSHIWKDFLDGKHVTSPTFTYTMKIFCDVESYLEHDDNEYNEPQSFEHTWAVCSCISSGDALKFAFDYSEQCNLGLQPCGGTAIRLVPESDETLSLCATQGELFCYLPVHIPTGLPVHINGGFALSSDRRGLPSHVKTDMNKSIEVQWNDVLMHDVICESYTKLLQDLLNSGKLNKTSYDYSHWPTKQCGSQYAGVVQGFYERVLGYRHRQSIPKLFLQDPFLNGDANLDIDNSHTLDPCLRQESVGKLALNILNQLLCRHNSPFRTIDISKPVLSTLHHLNMQAKVDKITVTKETFYKKYLFPNLNILASSIRDRFVLDIILSSKWKSHEYMKTLLQTHPCIPTSTQCSMMSKVTDLIDPTSKLAALYDKNDKRFPCGDKYVSENCLTKLREVGMAHNQLTWTDVIERAKSVQPLYNSNPQIGLQRVRALIVYLQDEYRSCPDTVKKKLHLIPFLPIMKKPLQYSLPWHSSTVDITSPSVLYTSSCKHLVSVSKPVINDGDGGCGHIPYSVMSLLKLTDKPDIDIVIKQLFTITEFGFIEGTTSEICQAIYSFLVKEIQTRKLHGLDHNVITEKLTTSRKPFLLTCRSFVLPDQMSFSLKFNCAPYLYTVCDFLKPFSELLKACGVRECFDMLDYVNAINQLAREKNHTKLTQDQLDLIINLTSHFRNTEHMYKPYLDKIYLPGQDCILYQPKDLAYNDVPWIEVEDGEYTFVHETFSRSLAIKLGVKPIRTKKVEEYSTGVDFFIGDYFGQNECLADRIKGILHNYPFGVDILKELVQNADDAQATTVHVIYDKRKHLSEKVFNNSWIDVMGPALCIYNDKIFTDKDIKGIQKLGIGGKRDAAEAIGQYGIGFNAVYHLTDCPTIVTNNTDLLIFDPHAKYAPGADFHHPGRRIPVGKLQRDYPDVYASYLTEQFDLKNSTMIRLPIRDIEAASTSNISNKALDTNKINCLIKNFKDEMPQMLLFLNHVKVIKISEITVGGETLQNTYSVKAVMTDDDAAQRTKFASIVKKRAVEILKKQNAVLAIPESVVSYELNISDSNNIDYRWQVTQKIGFSKSARASFDDDDLNDFMKTILPRGGIAALLSTAHRRSMYNTYSDYNRYGLHYSTAHETYVPKIITRQQSQVFCFLPLPVKTGLPVMVNGHFALSSDRRSLWENDIKGKWNTFIKHHIIATAYIDMLKALKTVLFLQHGPVNNNLELYEAMFPSMTTVHSDWKEVVCCVYKLLSDCPHQLIPVLQLDDWPTDENDFLATHSSITWHFLKDSYFNTAAKVSSPKGILDMYIRDDKVQSPSTLLVILQRLGFPLTTLSSRIYDHFKVLNIEAAQELSPHYVLTYLRGNPNAVGNIPCFINESIFPDIEHLCIILKYCLKGEDLELDGIPLLITVDEVLRKFNNAKPVYVNKYPNLIQALAKRTVSKYIYHDMAGIHDESIKIFTIDDLASHLHTVLPRPPKKYIDWRHNTYNIGVPWLKTLWKFLCFRHKNADKFPGALINWCIVPTTASHLIPLSNAKKILSPDMSVRWTSSVHNIVNITTKLGCAEIKYDAMCTNDAFKFEIQSLVADYLSDYNLRSDVANVLKCHLWNGDWCTTLSESDCTAVLKYFQEDMPLTPKVIDTIKNLPIFLTRFGSIVSIAEYSRVHVLASYYIPDIESAKWMKKYNCLILKREPSLHDIYDDLGITEISVTEVYVQYILPSFQSLGQATQLKHLDTLRINFAYLESEALINKLKHINFIPDPQRNNEVFPVSRFYDPENEIFQRMLPGGLFPPPPFNDKKWLQFLRMIGLHTKVSETDFIKFAKQIEEIECNDEQEAMSQAEVLIKLMMCDSDFHNSSFLKEISKIRFVPVGEVDWNLRNIYWHHSNANFTYFCNTVRVKYAPLMWTVAPVLPTWADPNEHSNNTHVLGLLCENLRIQKHPSLEMVLQHCKMLSYSIECNLAKCVGAYTHCAKMLISVWKAIYEYIMKQCEMYTKKQSCCTDETMCGICQAITHNLKDLPIIMLEDCNTIVKAKQIILKLSDTKMEPFIYSIPLDLGSYSSLFRLLGATQHPTESQLVDVLENIYKCSDGIKLDPNNLRIAFQAIFLLFSTIKTRHINNKKCTEDCIENYLLHHKLYLISTDDKIILSSDLVFHDVACNTKTLKDLKYNFLFDISKCGLDEFTGDLLKFLPTSCRPKYLSSIVRNEIVNPKPCSEYPSCQVQQSYQSMLSSKEFRDAILKILIKEEHVNVNEEIKQLLGNLQQITVKCLDEVNIQLINVESNSTVVNSTHKEYVYLEYEESNTILYLHHDRSQDRRFSSSLTKTVCKLLKNVYRIQLQIQDLLFCQHPDEIMTYLIENGYSTDEGDNVHFIQPVGVEIIEPDKHFLDHNPNYHFRPGEIVGYELDTSEGQSTYIYVQIVKEVKGIKDKQHFIQMYEIEIGKPETLVVTSLDLYKVNRTQHNGPYECDAEHDRLFKDACEKMPALCESILSEATLTDEQKRKAMKRLYFTWHPENNHHNKEIAGKIFEHITRKLDRFQQNFSYKSGRGFGHAANCNVFTSFYDHWGQEARAYHEKAHTFSFRSLDHDYSSFIRYSKPNPTEGKRWLRQAEADLRAASKDMEGDSHSFEWVCFKCQQAAEKALKGGIYTVVGDLPDSRTHSLSSLACTLSKHVSDMNVKDDAITLSNIHCDHLHPRYPDMYGGTKIPNDVYTQETAKKALKHTKQIVHAVATLQLHK
ncbi:sacsin-like [Saccoglossus kowalevskii]|uniref:Sacsin-like n=1 Tax=Saccoglossus kowalevskii TaxID=10224 RepID=A0ABM0GZ40_SACKO|nr:PREDICTED: sacsin-like [Saccoglossus kowalevskii]